MVEDPEYDPRLHVMAGEFRAMGISIPEDVPDCAWVPRDSYRWEVMDTKGDFPVKGKWKITMQGHFGVPFKWYSLEVDMRLSQEEVDKLQPGDVVRALKDLDPRGADVKKGDIGVVFRESNCHEPNTGPMVRWLRQNIQNLARGIEAGGMCNVYDGWVAVFPGLNMK